MKLWYVLALALAVALAAGCKKDSDAPAPTPTPTGSAAVTPPAGSAATPTGRPAGITDELVAQNAKVIATGKAVVAELTAANGDCAKMATIITTSTAKLKPDVDALGAMLEKLDDTSGAYFAEHMVAEMTTVFAAMDPVTAVCKDDPGVQAAAANYLKVLTGE